MRSGSTPTRLHAATGLVPTAAFLVLHSVQVFSAGTDRGGWVARVWGLDGGLGWTAASFALVALPLAIHVGLGVWLGLRRPDRAPASPPPAFPDGGGLRWQRLTGLVAAAFVLAHLATAWIPRLSGVPGDVVVDRLSVTLGQPAWLAVHALGLTAVAVHFAGGVPAAAIRLGWVREASGARATRGTAAAVALALWVLAGQATARLATGGAFP